MKESAIEKHLVKWATGLGLLTYKFSSPAQRSVPDRIVIGKRLVFVELKAPGKKPTAHQKYTHDKLRNYGMEVYVIDSKEGVEQLLEGLV